MTVTVTLPDGDVNEYLRFGDTYVEQSDGSLNVHRTGVNKPFLYAPTEWTGVQGDEHTGLTTKSWQFWKN